MAQNNRPINALDSQGRPIIDSVDDSAFQGEYSSNNLIYKGFARPGSSVDDPVWQIAYITYDGSANVTSITWPQTTAGIASNDYIFTWSDRASYTYS